MAVNPDNARLEAISQLLSQFNLRLLEMESRLDELQVKNTVIEERKIPEKIGSEFGGKSIERMGEGIQKSLRIPLCDSCKVPLNDTFALCVNCGRKICLNTCAVSHEQAIYCPSCFREELPITKKTFKVLYSFHENVTSVRKIKKATKMREAEVRQSIGELLSLGFLIKEGWLKKPRITDDGIIASEFCHKIFSKDVDVVQFLQELRCLA